jgi:hypothetical protein
MVQSRPSWSKREAGRAAEEKFQRARNAALPALGLNHTYK